VIEGEREGRVQLESLEKRLDRFLLIAAASVVVAPPGIRSELRTDPSATLTSRYVRMLRSPSWLRDPVSMVVAPARAAIEGASSGSIVRPPALPNWRRMSSSRSLLNTLTLASPERSAMISSCRI